MTGKKMNVTSPTTSSVLGSLYLKEKNKTHTFLILNIYHQYNHIIIPHIASNHHDHHRLDHQIQRGIIQ